MKTSELIGPALDWAVAKIEVGVDVRDGKTCYYLHPNNPKLVCRVTYNHDSNPKGYDLCRYSTDWSQGGPIIEREKITLEFIPTIGWRAALEFLDENQAESIGAPTALIAAMRCFVASKLGDEIEIPEELIP